MLLAVLLLIGCASLPASRPAESLLTGRFSATTRFDERSDNLSGRFTLALRRDGVTLDLATPLGNTLARVETSNGTATLSAPQADGAIRSASGPSAEALAEDMLGWTLPVSGLPDWIEGRPVAGRPAVLSPPQGLIETIEQDGWTIRILERFDASPDPRRIELARAQSTTSPSVVLRIVLDARSAKGQP